MGNITNLLEYAEILQKTGSSGRAGSLIVLSGKELGKAVWAYRASHAAWGGEANDVSLPGDFEERGPGRRGRRS
jgi:AbiV family abortive infection protein